MIKKILLIIFLIVFIFVMLIWRGVNSAINKNGKDAAFLINKGESISQIGQKLSDVGLIKFSLLFKYYTRYRQANIKAGQYRLSPSLSIKQIVAILNSGEVINQERTIRIIEGWEIRDIDDYFKKNDIAKDNNFLKLTKGKLSIWQFNFSKPEFLNDAPGTANLEGYLFPDTYRIFKDATSEEIINKMLANFDKKITSEMRAGIVREKKSIYEIITMASLIEKEVRTIEDMKLVSGIFWGRIKNREPLQSCATLAYILGIKKPQYTIADTKIDSPYNTYQNLGLPPGPISNPGLNAIKAAIYPVFSEYNYFLSKPDTGETIFSKSLDEHNKNKAKYLTNY